MTCKTCGGAGDAVLEGETIPCPECGGERLDGSGQVLVRLPPQVLRARRLEALGVFCAGAVFVAIGLSAILSEGADPEWEMYAVVAFFSLVAVVGLVQILPGSSFLRLDASGFTYRSLYREHLYRWNEVTSFSVVSVSAKRMVAFNLAPEYQGQRTGRALSRQIAGCDGALPDNYGKGAEELATLMNRYLERSSLDASAKP